MDSSHDPQTGGLQDSHPTPQQPGKVLPDPPGAKWFKKKVDGKGPQEQMFDYAKAHGHDFMVAFDYLEQKPGIKMYASYPGCEDFLRNTLYKTEDRHFYELITEGKPCKLYLDVEWEGPEDPEKRVIHHLVSQLKAYVKVRRLHKKRIFLLITQRRKSRAAALLTSKRYQACFSRRMHPEKLLCALKSNECFCVQVNKYVCTELLHSNKTVFQKQLFFFCFCSRAIFCMHQTCGLALRLFVHMHMFVHNKHMVLALNAAGPGLSSLSSMRSCVHQSFAPSPKHCYQACMFLCPCIPPRAPDAHSFCCTHILAFKHHAAYCQYLYTSASPGHYSFARCRHTSALETACLKHVFVYAHTSECT